jgi:ubiquinone/menaquinone biosynthesis C-methylase UbiE
MRRETAAENAAAVDLLEVAATDRVLELGFGHGRTLTELVSRAHQGHVSGLDTSPRMVAFAARANCKWISSGRMELRQGEAARAPYPSDHFDKILTVHTLYFWPQPAQVLAEIFRVLKPSGRFVMGFRPDDKGTDLADYPAPIYRFYRIAQVEGMLSAAGFGSVRFVHGGGAKGRVSFAVAGAKGSSGPAAGGKA